MVCSFELLDFFQRERKQRQRPFNLLTWNGNQCLLNNLITFSLCMYLCIWVSVEVRGQVLGVFSFHDLGSREWTQVIRLGSKHLLPESHLASPSRESLYPELIVGGVALKETRSLSLDYPGSASQFPYVLTRSPWGRWRNSALVF